MNFSIAFRNLPFTPVRSQVIYIENEYSQVMNEFIESKLDSIKHFFYLIHKEFVYLPSVTSESDIEQKVRYYAPYLQSEIVYPELPKSNFLLDYMANPANRDKIKPSLVWYDEKNGKDYIFNGKTLDEPNDIIPIPLTDNIIVNSKDRLADAEVAECCCDKPSRPKYSTRASCIPKHREDVCYSYVEHPVFASDDIKGQQEEIQPYTDDIDVDKTIRDLERTVARLQMKGITLAAIHEMIDKQEKLSRMVITPDYRIFLPDYGNREIEITPIAKALYFLFLRYPEGIRIKEMTDHHKELFNIYRQLKPNFNEAKMHITITEITNPFSNRVHEKMSLIRAAFLKQFDEHLAQHYFITGIAGEEYKITLDRNLIEWQEEE